MTIFFEGLNALLDKAQRNTTTAGSQNYRGKKELRFFIHFLQLCVRLSNSLQVNRQLAFISRFKQNAQLPADMSDL
jgi:hypothetical protein